MATGRANFTTQTGVQYVLDRYTTQQERDELRELNTEYSKQKFREKLISVIERGSGSRGWIPNNYEDELVENASAIIGTNRRSATLKNGKRVDVYTTKSGDEFYEDNKGRLRNYRTGRYAKRSSFEE